MSDTKVKNDGWLGKGAPTKDWSKVAEVSAEEKANVEKHEELSSDQDLARGLEHPAYKDLQDKLTAAELKATESWNQLLLTKADLENVRRRAERDLSNAHKYAIDKFAADLLPVVDSIERGLETSVPEGNGDLIKQFRAGMELTLGILLKILQKYGIEQVNPLGAAFNPLYHEAMAVQDEPTAAPNIVFASYAKGVFIKRPSFASSVSYSF